MEARIAQLDQIEAARKEAERVRLTAECAAATAVSKVYEDAIEEDNEQYLGSDDPDNEGEGPQSPSLKKGLQDSNFQGKGREQPISSCCRLEGVSWPCRETVAQYPES